MRDVFKVFGILLLFASCETATKDPVPSTTDTAILLPAITTEKVFDDSDDPAIWINYRNPDSSLVIGTDKNSANGGVYVFTLKGKIDKSRTISGLHRINNVDVAYGLQIGDTTTDIVVATERDNNSIRVFTLPHMKAIDRGGIQVFQGEPERAPMGISLYTRPSDKAIFAIVSRKAGPSVNYLEQYLLTDDGSGNVSGKLVRKFGRFSGKKEIESVAVDNELGYVYYSDEQAGIRKYYADPSKGNDELAFFGIGEFKEDNEGISIYKFNDGTGYILVSDQAANRFNIYPREGAISNPHLHERIAVIPVSTSHSDGSDVTSVSLPGFEGGLFVAMSEGGTFQYYRWNDIATRAGLKINAVSALGLKSE